MSFDGKANFAIAPVIVAPSPAVSGLTVTVQAGQGSLFTGTPPYNLTVWEPLPPLGQPTAALSEIVRVEKVEGDKIVFSERAQEGTTAKPIGPGWVIADTITVKALTDIEQAVETETARATAAENTEKSAREAGDSANAGAINVEKTRAEGVEALKATIASLNAEIVARESADNLRLIKSENLKDLGSASTARTNLGLGSAAVEPSSAFDPKGAAASAETAASTALAGEKTRAETQEGLKLAKAENLKDVSNAATARTNLGLGTAATEPSTAFDLKGAAAAAQTAAEGVTAAEKTRAETVEALKLAKASNLSDLSSASTARTNLGLGTAAVEPSSAFDVKGEAAAEKTRAEAAEALKAPLASPALTGTPTVPTATAGTNTTQAASTAFATNAKGEAEAKATTALGTEKTAREAADAEAVKLTGTQTIAGSKTFNSPPVVPTPTAANDAVSLEYMQSLLEGITPYANVVLATAAALPPNIYSAGTLTGVSLGALTIDGTTPVIGQRILVKNEATEANNGIYTITHVGAIAEAYVLTRASDMAAGATVKTGALTYATAGSTNANKGFWVVGVGPFTVATNPLKWEQYLGAQDIVAGEGISIAGNTIAATNAILSASPTGKRSRTIGIDVTAAPYNVNAEGVDSWEGFALAWEDCQSAWLNAGRRVPIILPAGGKYFTSRSLELFTGLALVTPFTDGRFANHTTLQCTAQNLFKYPSGSSGTVRFMYIDGITFEGNGQLKNTDFVTRQPTDASGWYIFDSIIRNFGAFYFASTFSGALQGTKIENPNINACGAHVPMVAHEWNGETAYVVGNKSYYEGWVFTCAENNTGTHPAVTSGVPTSTSVWTFTPTPMCSSCITGSDSRWQDGFFGGHLLAEHPIGLAPMFNLWWGMAASQMRGCYITGNPQMPLYVTGNVDRSEIYAELDGHEQESPITPYSGSVNYALYALVEEAGKAYSCRIGNTKGIKPSGTTESTANWQYVPQLTGTSGSAAYIQGTNPENGFTLRGNVNEVLAEPFSLYTGAVTIADSSNVDIDMDFRNVPSTLDLVKVLQSTGSCDKVTVRRCQDTGTSQMRVGLIESKPGSGSITNCTVEGLRYGLSKMVATTQRETRISANNGQFPSFVSAKAYLYLLRANLTTAVAPSGAVAGETYWIGFEQDGVGGHTFTWPVSPEITWLGGQTAPWDGTPHAVVWVKFKYEGGKLVEQERTIDTGRRKILPYKPRSGSLKMPAGTVGGEYQVLAADRNNLRLVRFEGLGQTFKKAAIQVTAAAEGGTALQAVIAAYPDDGSGTEPLLVAPLKAFGAIALGTSTGLKTIEENWTEPEGPYWAGYAIQWSVEPTKLPKIQFVQTALLPGTTLNANIRNWTQTEVSGAPTTLTALTGDGTQRGTIGFVV